MKLRKTMIAAAICGSVFASAASAVTIDGITFSAGAILETIDLFEGARAGGPLVAPGQELIGIGIVNRILDAGNNVLWQNGDNGRELTVYFYNYIAETFNTASIPGVLGVDTIGFSGGVVEIRSDSTPDFSAAGTIAQGIASASDGNLFLSLTGSPTGGFGGLGGAITLTSTGTRNGDAGAPFSFANNITGAGNLDVVGGAAASYFDTNTFGCSAAAPAPCPDDADKTFSSSGQIPVNPGLSAWAFRGTGEVQDFAIPEPGTLALLGLGLAAIGGIARRRVAAA